MAKSRKYREQWSLFLNEHNRKEYNRICRKCYHECKQSFRPELIDCPRYISKRRGKALQLEGDFR